MDTDEEDTDKEEGQEDEPNYIIGRTRDASSLIQYTIFLYIHYGMYILGLYEYGVLITFFAGNEVPGRFSHKSTKSFISFIVPLLLASHRIQGFNIFVTYAKEENYNKGKLMKMACEQYRMLKGLKWIYVLELYGIPGDGKDMIWLNHWRMESETTLQCGDEVLVSVLMRTGASLCKSTRI
ncbi:uncharacterized protein [Malus domestica]|uniref:uncharacterized protein n=1 Tax=Malus domestica TaxID=3750 RepID=UPI003976D7FD